MALRVKRPELEKIAQVKPSGGYMKGALGEARQKNAREESRQRKKHDDYPCAVARQNEVDRRPNIFKTISVCNRSKSH